MTYCVGIKLDAGLVFLSDSRTNAGLDQISTFRKMMVYEKPGDRFMVLLSAGNLSISQSVREILQVEQIDNGKGSPITIWNATSMFDAVRVLGSAVRRVYDQDGASLKEAGIDFNASLRRLERLQIFHRGAEATAQSARLKRHKSIPGRLQRRDQLAVADHRAKLRHALLGRAQAHFGFSRGAEQRVSQGRRRLADIHLQNRLCQTWIPNRQALQQLHAAE